MLEYAFTQLVSFIEKKKQKEKKTKQSKEIDGLNIIPKSKAHIY